MKRCGHRKCDRWFDETLSIRTVRRFCSDECRKAEFYEASKDAAYARAVERAEDRRTDRINGHGHVNGHAKIDLAALGLVVKPATIKRRKLDQQQGEQ